MDIRSEIIRIFEENGLNVASTQELENVDSIQYVSIIVEIEQLLNIAVPDFLLGMNAFKDFDGFVNVIIATYEDNQVLIEEYKNNAMLSNEHIDH